MAPIIRALDFDGRHGRFVGSVLAELCDDPAVIGYRQDVLDNLLRLPDLVADIAGMLPQLGELANISRTSNWGENIPLLQVATRLAELDGYVTCVERLWAALDAAGADLHATGLLNCARSCPPRAPSPIISAWSRSCHACAPSSIRLAA